MKGNLLIKNEKKIKSLEIFMLILKHFIERRGKEG